MKRLLPLLLIALIFGGCSVKSADDYYNETEPEGKYTASILINCSTAVSYEGGKRDNALILDKTSVSFNEGDTVFDLLKNACKQGKIQLDFKGSGDSVYVSGIDYLYEFDCGELSGWEYSVNGEFPSVGCNACEVNDGDEIRWLYTCELGADIGDEYKGESYD